MAGFDKQKGTIAMCLLLALATLLVYLPATRNGFVNFDDNEYIIDNVHVNGGLSWQGIAWAFRFTGYASNWHPLTWLSHAIDCQLFGLNPIGHHLTSILLHVMNSALVLLLFRQMTGSLWRSTFVAALFAWHPLHVESVAWASERKDVLSTFFWLVTTMAYVRYVKESQAGLVPLSGPDAKSQQERCPWRFYLLALFLFILGLMSKPMLVTLPFALLLLDFWPLRRNAVPAFRFRLKLAGLTLTEWVLPAWTSPSGAPDQQTPLLSLPWIRLVFEKLPFFLLAFIASLITYLTQQHAGAVSSIEEISMTRRVGNAAVACLRYVLKVVWPSHLAAIYPYPRHQPILLILAAVLFVLICSGLAILGTKRRPYLFTGWFWFLGTLVPTIGLVQVGSQAMADRYTYIPSIGLFALIVWGLRAFLMAWTAAGRAIATAAGIIALAAFVWCTSQQITTWHDSQRLYQHAIDVTTDNYIAYNGLGEALEESNKPDAALSCYFQSVNINPRYPEGQYNLGTALLNRGRVADAITHFNAALDRNPEYSDARNNLAKALMLEGKLDESRTQFLRAIQSNPNNAQAYYNLGTLLMDQSHPDQAAAPFSKAIQLKPDYYDAYGNLGIALMQSGRKAEGLTALSKAVELRSEDPAAHSNLGLALMDADRPSEAAAQFSAALQINSSDPKAHYNLARALARQHQTKDAISHYRAALGLKPDFVQALNNLAWILATDPNPDLRDSHEAVELAQKACQLTGSKQAGPLLTLGAAEAAAGQFTDAVSQTQKARDLAITAADQKALARADSLLKLFQAGQPFRESQ